MDLSKIGINNNNSVFKAIDGIWKKATDQPMQLLIWPVVEIFLIIILTIVVRKIADRLIDKLFLWSRMERNKTETLRNLTKSLVYYVLYFIAILTILSNLGLDPMPVLAGAGILGLAIGFGAQNLVRDIISGFFLIFERQLEVGDYVQINGMISGSVEEVGLRVTKIREYNQRLHYLSNGAISQVTNYNREKMRAIVSITVPYETDLNVVFTSLNKVADMIAKKYATLLIADPEVLGITKVDQTGVEFTMTALSQPQEYWTIERELRRKIVLEMNKNNIPIAYPRSLIYSPEHMKNRFREDLNEDTQDIDGDE